MFGEKLSQQRTLTADFSFNGQILWSGCKYLPLVAVLVHSFLLSSAFFLFLACFFFFAFSTFFLFSTFSRRFSAFFFVCLVEHVGSSGNKIGWLYARTPNEDYGLLSCNGVVPGQSVGTVNETSFFAFQQNASAASTSSPLLLFSPSVLLLRSFLFLLRIRLNHNVSRSFVDDILHPKTLWI